MSKVWETGWTEEGRRKVVRSWQKALERVAAHLESIEDTIVFYLLERAQFKHNRDAYEKGKSEYEGRDDESLLDIRLLKAETSDAEDGRYTMPEEVPFNKNIPASKRKVRRSMADMYSGVCLEEGNRVDLSSQIFSKYLAFLVNLCERGDDDNHGSATERDIPALRALAERIHYGAMYVAECKFNMDPEGYAELIKKKDREGLNAKLTRDEIEKRILARVRVKVMDFQKDTNPDVRRHVQADVIAEFYRDVVIPLTKEGEIQYLMQKKIG